MSFFVFPLREHQSISPDEFITKKGTMKWENERYLSATILLPRQLKEKRNCRYPRGSNKSRRPLFFKKKKKVKIQPNKSSLRKKKKKKTHPVESLYLYAHTDTLVYTCAKLRRFSIYTATGRPAVCHVLTRRLAFPVASPRPADKDQSRLASDLAAFAVAAYPLLLLLLPV